MSCSNFILDTSPEARETKAKIDYWDFIKIKSFLHCGGNSAPKKTNNPVKKWAEDRSRHFPKDIQMANRQMRRCSTPLIII